MRTLLILAALLTAAAPLAAPLPSDVPTLDTIAQAPPADDDDDDTPPAATPTPGPLPTEPKKDAPPAAPAAAVAPAPSAPASPDAQRLISGAPLYNPNVAVHIVEQKQFSDSGKRELVLFPIAAQANGKFTQHLGTMGQFLWHLQENFAVQVTGGYNWYNVESAFNSELVEKVRAEAQAASSLLWTWGVLGGVEVTPLYGKFAWFEGTLAHFGIVVNGGAGLGGTRHQIKPNTTRSDGTPSPATFGDTGIRFMGSLGAGFRLQLGNRFAFRLELRDVVYTARVESVDGCNAVDLKAMNDGMNRGLREFSSLNLGASCNRGRFEGDDAVTGLPRRNDVPLAYNLVKTPSSDVLNNVGLYVGASFLF